MLHFNFAIFLSIITISACNEIVNTNAGLVRGSLCKSIPDSKEYLSFTGIPYARPPVEDLRFKVRISFLDLPYLTSILSKKK